MRDSQQGIVTFEEACRRAGLRLTHQRLEIFRELSATNDHPSAEELHKRLLKTFPMISLDTVYRTLSVFVQHGLIHKVETAESQGRFEVRKTLHHHLICRNCKEIIDFKWTSFDAAPLPNELTAWGRIESRNAVVYGICRECEERNRPNP